MKKRIALILAAVLLPAALAACAEAGDLPPEPGAEDFPSPEASEPSPEVSVETSASPEHGFNFVTVRGVRYELEWESLDLSNLALTNDDIEALIEPLNALSRPLRLRLSGNLISDISALKRLADVFILDVRENPFGREQVEELIFALPGCAVGFDPMPDTEPEPLTDGNGFVWASAPRYPYENVNFCYCNNYAAGIAIVSTKTASILEVANDGHGYSSTRWLVDVSRDLFGYYVSGDGNVDFRLYPRSEFAARFPGMERRFLNVRTVDSSKIIELDEFDGFNSHDLSEAYLSDYYAVGYGGVIISDFIYEAADFDMWTVHSFDAWYPVPGIEDQKTAAMRQDGKWGVLDSAGETVIPFVFDHIVGIDGRTAFAKLDGLYGILDLSATIGNLT